MLLYGESPSPESTLDMDRYDLPPDGDAAAAAREHLTGTLEGWGWDHVVEAATTTVSELINCLLAGGYESLVLVVTRRETRVMVELRCRGGRFADVVQADPDRARGMGIVDDLVPLWGVRPMSDGDDVWFELH